MATSWSMQRLGSGACCGSLGGRVHGPGRSNQGLAEDDANHVADASHGGTEVGCGGREPVEGFLNVAWAV